MQSTILVKCQSILLRYYLLQAEQSQTNKLFNQITEAHGFKIQGEGYEMFFGKILGRESMMM